MMDRFPYDILENILSYTKCKKRLGDLREVCQSWDKKIKEIIDSRKFKKCVHREILKLEDVSVDRIGIDVDNYETERYCYKFNDVCFTYTRIQTPWLSTRLEHYSSNTKSKCPTYYDIAHVKAIPFFRAVENRFFNVGTLLFGRKKSIFVNDHIRIYVTSGCMIFDKNKHLIKYVHTRVNCGYELPETFRARYIVNITEEGLIALHMQVDVDLPSIDRIYPFID